MLNSEELINFIDTLIIKWPILADKIEGMLGVGLFDINSKVGENYGGTN